MAAEQLSDVPGSRGSDAPRDPGAARGGEATVDELAEPFPITLLAVSKHLKVLERAGLIARGRSAQLRPSRLEGEALEEAAAWLARYRRFWEDGFDRLDEHLREIQKGAGHG